MMDQEIPFRFTVFGIQFASEIACPDLPAGTEPAMVSIRRGKVDHRHAVESSAWFHAEPGVLVIGIRDVATYLIRHGREIIVDRARGGSADDERTFLVSAAIGGLVHQRGALALHAASIDGPGGALAFAGHSGTGKSTLLTAALDRGFAMLSDDLTAVTFDHNSGALAHPGVPHINLWAESVTGIGRQVDGLSRVRSHLPKYTVKTSDQFGQKARPLRCIYLIENSADSTITIEAVASAERFDLLRLYTRGAPMMAGQGLQPAHFRVAAAVAQHVCIRRLKRPLDFCRLPQVIDRIIDDSYAVADAERIDTVEPSG